MTYTDFKNKWLGKHIDLFASIRKSAWLVSFFKMRFTSIKLFVAILVSNSWMKCRMFLSGCYRKIFNSIIKSVFIFMMDNFMRLKETPKVFFHYKSMFSYIVTRGKRVFRFINKDVFASIDYATFPSRVLVWNRLPFSLTFFGTENLLTSFMAFIILKYFSTLTALKESFSGFVVTISTTKPSLLARRGIKSIFTPFTNISHEVIISHSALT